MIVLEFLGALRAIHPHQFKVTQIGKSVLIIVRTAHLVFSDD
jgi:hypothetical protein